jgi:DNA modification methylase
VRLFELSYKEIYMVTFHKIIIGDSRKMTELEDKSIHLMVTSPPYFNAPFDYKGLFKDYTEFLSLMKNFAKETYRVLYEGRIACVNCDDMLVDGEKYPIVADMTKIFMEAGFRYRDRVVWKKPEGYIRISRRSGVLLQHPYPMYYYPDNLLESILIFQKGRYEYPKITKEFEGSKIDTKESQRNKWYLTLWEMTNVLPKHRLEKGVAAFPEELPRRLIKLFSFKGETVLDPFLGSGTTMKVARELGRNSVGYEIKKELLPIIKEKVGVNQSKLYETVELEIIERN